MVIPPTAKGVHGFTFTDLVEQLDFAWDPADCPPAPHRDLPTAGKGVRCMASKLYDIVDDWPFRVGIRRTKRAAIERSGEIACMHLCPDYTEVDVVRFLPAVVGPRGGVRSLLLLLGDGALFLMPPPRDLEELLRAFQDARETIPPEQWNARSLIPEAVGIVDEATMDALPDDYRKAVERAVSLYRDSAKKDGLDFTPVFSVLVSSVEHVTTEIIRRRLSPDLPAPGRDREAWLTPPVARADYRQYDTFERMLRGIRSTLLGTRGDSPIPLLCRCLDYALNSNTKLDGVFVAVRKRFRFQGGRDTLAALRTLKDFRDEHVGHPKGPLTDAKLAEKNLAHWIATLRRLSDLAESRA